MSTLKVDAIRHNSATSDAITTAADGTCTAKITGRTGGGGLSNRNLIINGAMQIAQRGTSSTATGHGTVDRFAVYHSTDDAPTQSQSDVGLSDLPFTEQGITKCLKVTNGNQSGAGNAEYVEINYKCEAQDIRNSGWNYQASSSFITLSYYVRSSVAQTYTAWITNRDGTRKNFVWSYALSANTWTKITKVIPGDPNLTIDNDNGAAIEIWWQQYYGTNYTQASPPGHNTGGWVNHDNETVIDNTSTWYTTNDATFELTGVQLEVGDHATSFEHKNFREQLSDCQRYFTTLGRGKAYTFVAFGNMVSSSLSRCYVALPTTMRAIPTPSEHGNLTVDTETAASQSVTGVGGNLTENGGMVQFNHNSHSSGQGQSIAVTPTDTNSGLDFLAEL